MADATPKIMTLAEVRAFLRRNLDANKNKHPRVLWRHDFRGEVSVEEGSVLFLSGDKVDIVWLEGHHSRNDTVTLADILSVHEAGAPRVKVFPFSGPGYLTAAGVTWNQEHPES